MREFVIAFKFFVVSYSLNFFWESWHAYYLYWGYKGVSFVSFTIPEYIKLITRVSLVDAGILTAIFLGGFLIWKDWGWFVSATSPRTILGGEFVYFLIAAIGIAAFIEVKGVYLMQEWSYLPLMPTALGLGLSPLSQLAITGFIALKIIKK